jgi:hypothetical protein
MRALLESQTPIPLDQENPAYRAWLKQGYAEAAQRIAAITDQAGYYYTLNAYAAGFGDPHVALGPAIPLPPARWPGFVAAERGGETVVVWRDPADPIAPALGAAITACDGAKPADLAIQRFGKVVLNLGLEEDRRRAATRLFLDRGIPFAPVPTACVFGTAAGAAPTPLAWRPVGESNPSFWDAYSAAATGPDAPWGVSEPAPGVIWIGVPTFQSGEKTAPQLAALVEAIKARGPALRRANAIVIDVRGNGGGNSTWADKVAEAVFGAGVLAKYKEPARKEAVDWRASPENIAYWAEWEKNSVKEFGLFSTNRMGIAWIQQGMKSTLGKGEQIWRTGAKTPSPSGGMTKQRPGGERPFPAKVYMLSNGSCGSSCLNFADRVLFVPGVKLIGSATSGDGPYMEVRSEKLGSGMAELTFPQKVYRGMGRGALEAYQPDIAYDGGWDDASVRAWVMGLIAAR